MANDKLKNMDSNDELKTLVSKMPWFINDVYES